MKRTNIALWSALGMVAYMGMSVVPAAAQAETFPDKPIRLVVPYAPGGGTDTLSRIVSKRWGELIGEQIVIENRGGAGGAIGTAVVAQAAPDGYTLVMATNATHAINPSLYDDPGYDAVTDFEPISLAATTPSVLVVSPTYPVNNVAELIEFIKEDGRTSYASAGPGSSAHLGAEMFKALADVDIMHVPYKGAGPASIDLVSGRITMMFDTLPASLTNIRAGKLRLLAVSSDKPVDQFPDAPLISDTVPGYQFESWYAVLAPAGTPSAIVEKLNETLTQALNDEDVKQSLFDMGLAAVSSTPEGLADRINSEIPKWKAIIDTSGAKVD